MSTLQELDAWITCGQFGRAHGIRGDVRLWAHNPKSQLLTPGQTLAVTQAQTHRTYSTISTALPQHHYKLKRVRKDAKGLIVSLQGIHSRQQAEALNHCLWVMQRQNFETLAEDEFYFADLIGFVGILDDQRTIGVVQNFIEAGAGMVLVFKGEYGEVMVPYVDAFIIRLDLANQQIHIRAIDGLVEGGI